MPPPTPRRLTGTGPWRTTTRLSYAALRADAAPAAVVERAAAAARMTWPDRRKALDVGAGPLHNTRYLLEAGFAVDAVDVDPVTASLATELVHPRLRFAATDITRFPIGPATYSLVVAIHVLPFLPAPGVARVLAALRRGLVGGGVLCCTVLGDRDGWADCRPRMSFVSRRQWKALTRGFRDLELDELEYDGVDALGMPKRWHVLRSILVRQAGSANQHGRPRLIQRGGVVSAENLAPST